MSISQVLLHVKFKLIVPYLPQLRPIEQVVVQSTVEYLARMRRISLVPVRKKLDRPENILGTLISPLKKSPS